MQAKVRAVRLVHEQRCAGGVADAGELCGGRGRGAGGARAWRVLRCVLARLL